MKFVSFLVVGMLLGAGDAWAIYGQDRSNLIKDWGVKTSTDCAFFGDDFDTSNGCLSNCGKNKTVKNMMIAREMNEHGAQFCLTAVAAKRFNNAQDTSTWYYDAVGEDVCFWLCKDGYSGEECKDTVADSSSQQTCDYITIIDMEKYKGRADACTHGGAGSNNISCNTTGVEKEVSMFFSQSKYCEDKLFNQNACDSKHEMDVVLGLLGATPSGHGGFAQAMTVRAFCGRNKNDSNCRIAISPAGSSTKHLLCLDGYKPNPEKTDCVPISEARCSGLNVSECKGWDSSRFSGDEYTTTLGYDDKGQSCLQYRCAASNYGFVGDPQQVADCVKCEDTEDKQATLLKTDGRCVFHDKGVGVEVQDDGSVKEIPLTRSTKSDMSRGDCWKRETPEEYKECLIKGKGS